MAITHTRGMGRSVSPLVVAVDSNVKAQVLRQVIVITITQHVHVIAYETTLIVMPVTKDVHVRY